MKNIVEAIKEAQTLAFREHIETNMIFFNKNFAKTNPSVLVFDRELYCLPPMLLGMEVQITDELPEKVSFALTKGTTERDKLIAEKERSTAQNIWDDCIDKIMRGCGDDKEFWVIEILIETFKKYGVGFEVE